MQVLGERKQQNDDKMRAMLDKIEDHEDMPVGVDKDHRDGNEWMQEALRKMKECYHRSDIGSLDRHICNNARSCLVRTSNVYCNLRRSQSVNITDDCLPPALSSLLC